MYRLARCAATALFWSLVSLGVGHAAAQGSPAIAAASDLQFALPEIAQSFAKTTGNEVRVVLGSSGVLTRQILDGAPFELFMSADESFVTRLVDAGLARDGGVIYAEGRLALFAPTGSPLTVDDGLRGLAALIEGGGVTRFAIANPSVAPYGRAAEAVLRKHGLWTRLQPVLVLGENVSQAAQFASSGNAVGGLIAHSLASSPALTGRGTFALVPSGDHPPLRQRMVLLKRAGPVAQRFFTYLQSPEARRIFERYGFEIPGR
ncbi:MAG: molybdate ABC transporter substrate-binding protein [Vicinamibacterales bacterium]